MQLVGEELKNYKVLLALFSKGSAWPSGLGAGLAIRSPRV